MNYCVHTEARALGCFEIRMVYRFLSILAIIELFLNNL